MLFTRLGLSILLFWWAQWLVDPIPLWRWSFLVVLIGIAWSLIPVKEFLQWYSHKTDPDN